MFHRSRHCYTLKFKGTNFRYFAVVFAKSVKIYFRKKLVSSQTANDIIVRYKNCNKKLITSKVKSVQKSGLLCLYTLLTCLPLINNNHKNACTSVLFNTAYDIGLFFSKNV